MTSTVLLWQRKVAIVLSAVVLALVAGLGSRLMPERFTSSADVYLSVTGATTPTDVAQGGTYLEGRMKSYVLLATSAEVLSDAADTLPGSDASASSLVNELRRDTTITIQPDTTVMTVSVTSPDADRAQAATAAVADALTGQIRRVETRGNDFSPIRAVVINDATLPTSASSPKVLLNALLGAVVGAGLAVMWVLARAALRDVPQTERQQTRRSRKSSEA